MQSTGHSRHTPAGDGAALVDEALVIGSDLSAARVVLLVAWCLAGALIGLGAGRRGHDGRAFAGLGLLFGPLVAPLVTRAAHDSRLVGPICVAAGEPGAGDVDAVVLSCGPATRGVVADLRAVLGTELGRVTVVDTIDYESARFGVASERARRALHDLTLTVRIADTPKPAAVLVPGPRRALLDYARDRGATVVAAERDGSTEIISVR